LAEWKEASIVFKFFKELKDAAREGFDEGVSEGKAELAAEEATARADEEAARAEERAQIAGIPPDEQFAAALAAPWRLAFFCDWDWYSPFKDDSEDDVYPVHLYTFGVPGLLTDKEISAMKTNDLKRDFGAVDRESSLRAAAEWLRFLSFSANREVSALLSEYDGFDDQLCDGGDHEGQDKDEVIELYRSHYGMTGVFSASALANALTSAVDVGYVEKELAMAVLRDVSDYVRGQCEDWEDYAAQFLAGEAELELNDKKGRKKLGRIVDNLIEKRGSPWNNVPFEHTGRYANGDLPALYTEDELDAIEAHIEARFGNYEEVFHEIKSPDIHVDICIIPPTEERPWQTFVTMGMGACRMNVPREMRNRKLDRAELLVCLPPDWDISKLLSDDGTDDVSEEIYWPIRYLKVLARLPIEHDTYLGYGHTVPSGNGSFAENTGFDSVMLTLPNTFGIESFICVLPDGGEVNFYQVIPLYESELTFKKKHDATALEELLCEQNNCHVVDIERKPVV
jgi:hypothetical protein